MLIVIDGGVHVSRTITQGFLLVKKMYRSRNKTKTIFLFYVAKKMITVMVTAIIVIRCLYFSVWPLLFSVCNVYDDGNNEVLV